ncbi:hypothetical protein VSDG_08421 [Cytospora chrysosperma]|uniref:Uncharacterized protein n=1 Tax=Cytospora chrysosperma TaxID=252740 RepID=A0A423VHJ7_CYTCH|nr:hypothetical protein VSDG_08421 [Valsa sordida]
MEGRDNEIGSSSPNRTHDDAENPQEGKHEPDGNEALDDGDSPISLPPIMPSEPIETMTTSRLRPIDHGQAARPNIAMYDNDYEVADQGNDQYDGYDGQHGGSHTRTRPITEPAIEGPGS